jgi:hypothetical protein
MKRLFWLGVGVAAGVMFARKARGMAHQATPAGVAANLGEAMREVAGAVGSFGADVRAGMTERERELHSVVEQRTGIVTGEPAWHPRDEDRPAPRARRGTGGRAPDARARRAGG